SVHWLTACVPALRSADAVLVGETGELDTMEYVRDSNALGMPKGLLVISHNMLEEWGMRPAADWVAELFPELPVKSIASGEPYWLPETRAPM
ncbi:MAG: hypothetical protein JOZ62_03470, partial [Acidobacteriaceae bacterium]|nr:hypothetical protein [Acidobacteriaceae bacterium]